MIPTDVGLQVRTQTEPNAQPVRAIPELSANFPEMLPGHAFRARIQEVLPENTYKAVVAGRLMTLSLPEGAKAGDTLELVVVGRTARSIVAQRGDAPGSGVLAPFENASLSRTGQLIASLLSGEGEAPPPANLTQGGPVLAKVPANAAQMARDLPPNLSRAVAASGMFYEAHQVQWVLGERPLASLLAEPQGRFSQLAAFVAAVGGENESFLAAQRGEPSTPSPRELQQSIASRDLLPAGLTDNDAAATLPAQPLTIPDELRQLVQQQLEAGASDRLIWRGEVWPGQTMEWEIQRDGKGSEDVPESQDLWQTRLHLRLPRLGEIDVRLQFSGGTVNVMLDTPAAASGLLLQSALPALQQSFSSAGLNLAGAQVKRESV